MFIKTEAQQDEEQREREREFPRCDNCDGHIGLDCPGHCVEEGCDGTPVKGEDICAACKKRINAIGMCSICGDPSHGGKCEGFGDE